MPPTMMKSILDRTVDAKEEGTSPDPAVAVAEGAEEHDIQNPLSNGCDQDVEDDDDDLFFGLDGLVSFTAGTLSTASCASSYTTSSTTTSAPQRAAATMTTSSGIIPTPAATVSSNCTQIKLLEETCQDLKNDHDPSTKEDVLIDMFAHADCEDLDAIVSKHLEKMSIEERMEGCKEVHGINNNNDVEGGQKAVLPTKLSLGPSRETTATAPPLADTTGTTSSKLVQNKLREFRNALETSPTITKGRQAYDLALSADKDYVQDSEFLLLFLRSENNNIQAAIARIYKHFEMKLELFGGELLVKDITLNDLNSEDIKCLECGTNQILPQRDHADRPIYCVVTVDDKSLYNSISMHRANWYQSMVLLRTDEILQSKGAVLVLLNIGKNRVFFDTFGYTMKCKRYFDGIPYRAASIHCCYDSPLAYNFAAFYYFLFRHRSNENVMKFLFHLVSSHSECYYKLQSFGIPTNLLPHDEVGSILVTNHLDWIRKQRAREEAEEEAAARVRSSGTVGSSIDSIVAGPPRKFDVLLGRGKIASSHTGNLRLFHIVDMNRARYDTLGRFQKTRLSAQIVHLVHQSGGRFLKKVKTKKRGLVEEQWIEVTTDEARDKISHSFRRLRELDSLKNNCNRDSDSNNNSKDGEANVCDSQNVHANSNNARRFETSSATDKTTSAFAKRSKVA